MTRTAWLILWLLVRATLDPPLDSWSAAYCNEPSKWLILRFRDAAMQRLTIAVAYTSDDRHEAALRAYPGTKTKRLDIWVAILCTYTDDLADRLRAIDLDALEASLTMTKRR